VNKSNSKGYGAYEPPKEDKRHPLTRSDTEALYQAACEYPDLETELSVRVLLDYGLRCGELSHSRDFWVDKEHNRRVGEEIWRISVPKVEECYGGKGGNIGKGNPDGSDLHRTNAPCSTCVNRSWEQKVAPDGDEGRGWISQQQAEKYDYSPKTERSATKVWQFPGISETKETAQKLKKFLSGQSNGQWPHGSNAIRNRVDKVVERADLDLPDRSRPKVVPHALRHTYGCRLVEMSLGEGAAMKQMRHQNPDIFRWYSDVRGTRVISALNDATSENDSLLNG
jgi:integrase